MSEINCPVCKYPAETVQVSGGADISGFDCPHCGKYFISGTARHYLEEGIDRDSRESRLLSHLIRNRSISKTSESLSLTDIKAYLQFEFPTLSEQILNLIEWIGKNTRPGEGLDVTDVILQPIIGAETPKGVQLVILHLKDEKLIESEDYLTLDQYNKWSVELTVAGWREYDEMKTARAESKKAFIAMDFKNDAVCTIVNDVFKPAVKQTGFILRDLREGARAGLIDSRLRVEIRLSRFMIVDLTDDNYGAYWEAGFAEGIGIPVIYTCEKSKFEEVGTHFDTNHQLTVPWDKNNPLEAGDLLKAIIRATLPEEAMMED